MDRLAMDATAVLNVFKKKALQRFRYSVERINLIT